MQRKTVPWTFRHLNHWFEQIFVILFCPIKNIASRGALKAQGWVNILLHLWDSFFFCSALSLRSLTAAILHYKPPLWHYRQTERFPGKPIPRWVLIWLWSREWISPASGSECEIVRPSKVKILWSACHNCYSYNFAAISFWKLPKGNCFMTSKLCSSK